MSAAVRTGCDVVDVRRLAGLLARHPGARDVLFTAGEQAAAVRDGVAPDADVALRRLAARFAAKEAAVKLLGRPALRWTDVEVVTDADGAPSLRVLGLPSRVAVSLAHDGDVAIASVAAVTADLPDVPARRTTDATDTTDLADLVGTTTRKS